MINYEIGILTFWGVPNYGTFAQAYALQKVLQEINKGSDVRQIAHLDSRHFNFYFNRKAYLRTYPFWKKNFWRSFFVRYSKKNEDSFANAYASIPHTERVTKDNLDSFSFDKIFLGSDIIWDYSMDVFNNDPLLFGVGFHAEVNAYAASFGTVSSDANLPDYVLKALKNMRYISVRDKKSAAVVERLTGKRPKVVLDPTWLWNFNEDRNVIKPKEEGYILVYGQDFTPDFINNLCTYAKVSKRRIIALDCNNDHYGWCDEMISQKDLTPFQWLGYFKYAAVVATSTFHGITFSLIFNKNFAFCKTSFIMAKVDQFLKELNLFELFDKDENDVFGMLNHDFNYPLINKIIEKKKEESLAFLCMACNKNGK